jgi:hypothetical protein
MAGTFHQIYIQYVFAVKGRENLFQKPGEMMSSNTFPESSPIKVRNQLLRPLQKDCLEKLPEFFVFFSLQFLFLDWKKSIISF